ncbi:MAG TPA: ATP-binding cassette domain-containing protein, partial [Coriobacteriia bacterium]|nr:ATP-binding cassette domain-containing protein [Coriobacteriia bacterium]
VPQQIVAAFSVPAVDFVSMGRHPHLARFAPVGEVDREVVFESMRLTDTAHLADKPVDALSGGDLQRLALAQALAQKPRLLLLDEPTSHLDLNHRLQVLDLVRDLVAMGMGVLAVFHDLDLAARYSDRIAVVAEGAVGEAAAPEQVITAEMLRITFGVRAVVGIEPVTGAISVTPVLREGAVVSRGGGRVHVIGGSGAAAPLIRRLVLAGWEVTAGALNAGDADATLCEALDLEYVALPAFAPMDDAARAKVARLAAMADAVVVCDVPFGNGNVGNLEAVADAGVPLVLINDIAGRDYTGGRATELWARLVATGARLVSDADEAASELEALSAQTE